MISLSHMLKPVTKLLEFLHEDGAGHLAEPHRLL